VTRVPQGYDASHVSGSLAFVDPRRPSLVLSRSVSRNGSGAGPVWDGLYLFGASDPERFRRFDFFQQDRARDVRFPVECRVEPRQDHGFDFCARTPETIRSIAADFSDEILAKLEPLDQEFFSYPHNLTGLLFAYVSEHPAEFGTLPKPDDAQPHGSPVSTDSASA
jgi:hypothetical protein